MGEDMSAEDLAEAEQLLASATRPANIKLLETHVAALKRKMAPPAAPEQKPVKLDVKPASQQQQSETVYETIERFAWDQGEYNSQWVCVYLTSGFDGLGKYKECVSCDFTASSFDLKILDFEGRNCRMFKDNLDKDIVPEESKFIVKKNGVTIKLKKKKGEFSYDHWTDLTSKKSKEQKKANEDNPMGGIMDMMKEMYDSGDEQMKKTIGEAMPKQQQGGGGGPPDMPDMPPM